jgi:hypothetical protein
LTTANKLPFFLKNPGCGEVRTKHALSTPGLASETGGYARDLAPAVAWEPVAQLLKEQTMHMLINAAKRLSEIIRESNRVVGEVEFFTRPCAWPVKKHPRTP